MSKQEFLAQLRMAISGLPKEDVEDRLDFYSEMIDDRIEEGLSEEEAVCEIGNIEAITSQIIGETPLAKIVKEKIKPKKKMKMREIILLILGSPLWISIVLAIIAVALSIYVALWSVIVSFWAVFVSLIACALGGAVAGIIFAVEGNVLAGIAMISAALVCAGLSIFAFYGCKAITKGILLLTKKISIGIKNWFVKKEEV